MTSLLNSKVKVRIKLSFPQDPNTTIIDHIHPVAGIYYLVLHAKTDNGPFCEIDLNTEDGMNRIRAAVKTILKDAYD